MIGMDIYILVLLCLLVVISFALGYKFLYKKQINRILKGCRPSIRLMSPFTFLVLMFFIVTCGLFIYVYKVGLAEYWSDGASYYINNDEYKVETYPLDESFTFSFNPNEKEKYEGTYIIEHNIFSVRVDEIRITDGEDTNDAHITFYLFIESKKFDFNHGKIVAEKPESKYGTIWSSDNEPDFELLKVTTNVNNKIYSGSQRGEGPYIDNGIYIAITIVDYDERNGEDQIKLTDYEQIDVTFENFVVNEYTRK